MFRIEEAKILLTNSRNSKMNISQIAAEVGFNSISAFNAAFRKFTGLSPLQIKNEELK